MAIDKNNKYRQVVANPEITSNKEYCDFLYGYLQANSMRGEDGRRFLLKNDCKFTVLVQKMNNVLNRKTMSKYFNFLVDEGLIYEEEDKYFINELDRDSGYLLDFEILNALVELKDRHAIDLYVYLVNLYFANGKKSFIATMRNMKEYVGLATSTTSNNEVVKEALDRLQDLGLISYRVQYLADQNKRFYKFNRVKSRA